jgi:phospholipase C
MPVFHGPRTLRVAVMLATAILVPNGAAARTPIGDRIKHVFIIYQENRSFDSYFGTFPGAENLASPLAQTHGFTQHDPLGGTAVQPFRITDPDTEGPSQSRPVALAKIDGGAMDGFVAAQEAVSKKKFGNDAAARDVGALTMAYYDCDTIPYLWKYAHAFALFDHYFQGMTAPSTPNAIEIIAAQTGQTQWARDAADRATAAGPGVPVTGDTEPHYGPYSESDDKATQIPQRYATLMLTLGGTSDDEATTETQGVAADLATIAKSGRAPVPWGWYQEGYVSPTEAKAGYESHHNAPQYFGYLRQNDVFWKNVHEVHAMLDALRDGTLPDRGVFYIKGGSQTSFPWKPANPDPYVQANWRGDDDHPGKGDSDVQVGEAFVATFVNAIARSKYWNDSAIVITWDDPGGYYDHVPPPQFEKCADGAPCGDGPRVPMMIVSPFARDGAVVHDPGDTGSVLKLVESLFGLPALASLPDEKPYLPEGPRDGNAALTDLTGAFDPERIDGTKPPISAAAAEIPDDVVNAMPPAMNCRSLGITPVTLPNAPSTPPPGFAPRIAPSPANAPR